MISRYFSVDIICDMTTFLKLWSSVCPAVWLNQNATQIPSISLEYIRIPVDHYTHVSVCLIGVYKIFNVILAWSFVYNLSAPKRLCKRFSQAVWLLNSQHTHLYFNINGYWSEQQIFYLESSHFECHFYRLL